MTFRLQGHQGHQPQAPSSSPAAHLLHDGGLFQDMQVLQQQVSERRRALRWLGMGALTSAMPLGLLACGGAEEEEYSSSEDSSSSTSSDGACSVIPTETAGPYPGDGTNGGSSRINALVLSGIVRSDIRSSIAGASGTATGVPLTVTLNVVDVSDACAPVAGYAVYMWHADALGRYSLYSSGVTGQNYLRGVQVTDDNGSVTFTTIFPGCYDGRWPHIHFEIYASLSAALGSSRVGDYAKVSQIAMPYAVCSRVYATSGYTGSASNLSKVSLSTDNVFSDDRAALQVPSVSGSVSAGFAATLVAGI